MHVNQEPGTKIMETNKLISININYFNPKQHPRIEATLILAMESVSSYTRSSFEMIIADASTNESAKIKDLCLKNNWIYLHMPGVSFQEGNNKAFSKVTGEYLVLMASDVFVCEGWDTVLLSELKRTGAWMVAPYLTASDYPSQRQLWVFKMKTFIPSAMTLNIIMMKTEHFRRIGMLDQRLGHFNDIDLLFRVRESGGEGIITYCGQVSHISGATCSVSTNFKYYKDKDIFLEKHPCLKTKVVGIDYNHYDKRFMRSRILRIYCLACHWIPFAKMRSFMLLLGARIEPLLNKI